MGILKNNEYDNPEFFRQYAGRQLFLSGRTQNQLSGL